MEVFDVCCCTVYHVKLSKDGMVNDEVEEVQFDCNVRGVCVKI